MPPISPEAASPGATDLVWSSLSLSLSLSACGNVCNSGWLILVVVGWLILVGGDGFVTMVGCGGGFVSVEGCGGGGSELLGVIVGIFMWFFLMLF